MIGRRYLVAEHVVLNEHRYQLLLPFYMLGRGLILVSPQDRTYCRGFVLQVLIRRELKLLSAGVLATVLGLRELVGHLEVRLVGLQIQNSFYEFFLWDFVDHRPEVIQKMAVVLRTECHFLNGVEHQNFPFLNKGQCYNGIDGAVFEGIGLPELI